MRLHALSIYYINISQVQIQWNCIGNVPKVPYGQSLATNESMYAKIRSVKGLTRWNFQKSNSINDEKCVTSGVQGQPHDAMGHD